MPEVNLTYAGDSRNPHKFFLVCDLDGDGTFADPLALFSLPEYDIYDINKEGLYAFGGELDTETLVKSYKWGIFPWFPYKDSEEPYWYCPRQRFVIFPEKIHAGHSLRNMLNKGKYHITVNKAFRDVIHNCRTVDGRDCHEQAWLGDNLESLFIELHDLGYAKSVEVWEGNELAGGFYGFWNNGVFQGESMFSLRPSASQIGLILLCRQVYLDDEKIKLIDTQFENSTFRRLGGEYITYERYRQILDS